MKKIQISPSILAAEFAHLAEEIKSIEEAGADYIHFDVMDNHFVPNLTFGFKFIKDLQRVTNLKTDIHLMIENPADSPERFLEMKPDLITFHYETVSRPEELIDTIKKAGSGAGISIKPSTGASLLEPLLSKLDSVLIMLVEPGFSGQKMIKEALFKIQELKILIDIKKLNVSIQVDGGIKKDNFEPILESGADNFVLGSGIFAEDDYASVIQKIKSCKY
ncbi:MAG: ribulose-phosphate 3-epimerase [Spirochaetes bacterium]|nr:ribulose-phosphate 3-epimerase [Spirochaetota bacterium]